MAARKGARKGNEVAVWRRGLSMLPSAESNAAIVARAHNRINMGISQRALNNGRSWFKIQRCFIRSAPGF